MDILASREKLERVKSFHQGGTLVCKMPGARFVEKLKSRQVVNKIQTNLVNPSFHTFMTSISESRSLLNKIIFIQILGISGAITSFPQESHNFDENNFFWPERVDAPTSMSCLQYVVPRTPATVQSCPFCPFIFSFYSHNSERESEVSIPVHPCHSALSFLSLLIN